MVDERIGGQEDTESDKQRHMQKADTGFRHRGFFNIRIKLKQNKYQMVVRGKRAGLFVEGEEQA
jgi:hypothetical protein